MKHRDAILTLLAEAIDDAEHRAAAAPADPAPVNEAHALRVAHVLLSGGTMTVTLDLHRILDLAPPGPLARRTLDGDLAVTLADAVERRTPDALGVSPVRIPVETNGALSAADEALPACDCADRTAPGEHADDCPRGIAVRENLERLQRERGGIDALPPLVCNCADHGGPPVEVDGVLWHREGCVYYRPERHGGDALEAIKGSHPSEYLDLFVRPKARPEPEDLGNGRDDEQQPVDAVDEEVRDAIERLGGAGAPFTLTALGDALGLSRVTARRRLAPFVERGDVRREGHGAGSRIYLVGANAGTPEDEQQPENLDPERDLTQPDIADAALAAGVETAAPAPPAEADLLAEVERLGGTVERKGDVIVITGPKGEARINPGVADLASDTIRAHVKRVTGLMLSGSAA